MSASNGLPTQTPPRDDFQVPLARSDCGVMNSAVNSASWNASAPVSSLLPPIHAHATSTDAANGMAVLSQHPNPAVAQLAALLQTAVAAPAAPPQAMMVAQHPSPQPTTIQQAATMLPPNMQTWSLEKLEQHVNLLRQVNQHIPQNVLMLLNEAKKRAEKRHAKRIANRKSACTSRARKKALVQEMTELNTRLRRQALILSLLPDLVIVIDVTGKITFCSAQVERALEHNISDLVGAQLSEILAPVSREKLQNLIQELVNRDNKPATEDRGRPRKKAKLKTDKQAQVDGAESTNAVTDTTDDSFPLSVVKLDSSDLPALDENSDASENSNSKQPSSLTNSSLGNSGLEDGTTKDQNGKKRVEGASSDSSNTSLTVSTDAKNLQSANANLERNVRWHNKKLKHKTLRKGYKDDVIGADVTANNASARLSSLQHMAGSMSSSEDDSGYRESNDSLEETSSSEGDNFLNTQDRKPVAPACNICLMRNDLSTVWCEVTSSIRTKEVEEAFESSIEDECVKKPSAVASGGAKRTSSTISSEKEIKQQAEQCKEILLCLRPVRKGDKKLDEGLRFKPKKAEKRVVSEDNNTGQSSSEATPQSPEEDKPVLPPEPPLPKDRKDIDTAVVESLMSMSNQKANQV